MEAGTTFYFTEGEIHLWVIISDPVNDPAKVLIVNFTTLEPHKEQVCIIQPGEHPWVRHPTCVNYGDARVASLQDLYNAKDHGLLKLHDPLPPDLLKRVRECALDSERMAMDHAQLLMDQGLVEC